jgi:hypothetical protein
MATAPHDGTEIVVMYVVHYVGGHVRPIDITPEFEHARRVRSSPNSDGYWQRVIPPAIQTMSIATSVGDRDLARGWWTTLPEYAAAVPITRGWRSAPKHVPGFIVCPLVFVRPVERPNAAGFGPMLAADIAWPTGSTLNDRWHMVRGYSPGAPAMPFYLDGENVAAGGYCWLMLNEFFPPEFFERQLEVEREHYEARCDEWRRRRARVTCACDDLVPFADGELSEARAQAFRDHLLTCAACRAGLPETLCLAAQLSDLKKPE